MTHHDIPAGVHAPNRRPGPRLSPPPSGEAGAQPWSWRQLQQLCLLSTGGGAGHRPGSGSGATQGARGLPVAGRRCGSELEGGCDKNMTIHDIPAGVPPYAAGAVTRDEGSVVRDDAKSLPAHIRRRWHHSSTASAKIRTDSWSGLDRSQVSFVSSASGVRARRRNRSSAPRWNPVVMPRLSKNAAISTISG